MGGSTFPGAPKLLKGGLVLLDPETGAVRQVIALQYNPETLTRSFQIQAVGESADRSQALRIKAPAVESCKLDIVLDAADALEFPDQNADTVRFGLQPQLAVLEGLVNPASARLQSNNSMAGSGVLEILPMEQPLTLFVWSRTRVVPVRVTELSITEENFGPDLNPIRAKVSLGLRVLSVNDLGFDHRGGSLFMAYLQQKEQLASKSKGGALADFGLGGLP
jgi:hypothetical protein